MGATAFGDGHPVTPIKRQVVRASNRKRSGAPRGGKLATVAGLALVCGALSPRPVLAADVYTIAKYPIEGVARNAVDAKREALANGQQRALRSLLKRLVPVTSYTRITMPSADVAAGLIDGFRVRNEQNSRTEYLAVMDFTFQPKRVQEFVASQGLVAVDRQSAPLLLLPIFSERPRAVGDDGLRGVTTAAAPGVGPLISGLDATRGAAAWAKAWRSLDLDNALTPLQVSLQGARLSEAVKAGLLAGESGAIRALSDELGVARAIIAYAEPTADGRGLTVILAGRDAVGEVFLQRRYVLDFSEPGFTFELASVVGLGILEGRWKARNAPASPALSGAAALAGPEQLQIVVRFNSLPEWQQMRRALAEVPGVGEVNTASLSRRQAQVSVGYSGGVAQLSSQLAAQGFRFVNQGGRWVMSR